MKKRVSHVGVRLFSGMALGLTLLFASFGVASAHAKVLTSDPGIGSTISQAPTRVTVTTAENIKPGAANSNLFVYGPNGDLISQGDAKVDLHNPKQMSVALKPEKNGVYVVQWKTVSATDGDPDQGAYTFTVGTAAPAAPASTAPKTTASNTTTASSTSPSPLIPIITGIVALLVGLGAGFGLSRSRKPATTTPADNDLHTRV